MKKTIKSVISVLCAVVLLFNATAAFASAGSECSCGKDPVIMISGFGATTLAMDGEAVFPPSTDSILSILGKYGIDIGTGLVEFLATKNIDNMGNALIKAVNEIIEPIRMNMDGTSHYDIEPIVYGAEETSLAAFKANNMLDYVPYTGSDFLDMQMIADEVGEDHCFNFTFDWRKSNSVVADELLAYIEDVRTLTGHEKVDVYCISQGSLLMGEYLTKYADKGYLDNIVFDTPLLGGSFLVSDIFDSDNLYLDFAGILDLLGCILHTELDLSSIAEKLPRDTLDFIVHVGAKQVIFPVCIYAPAFWEMLPPDKTDYFADQFLTAPECAPMIEQIKSVQQSFMCNVSEVLHAAEENGASVYIKACTDLPVLTGSQINSDGIVNTVYSCGAAVSDFGKTFDDSYVQAVDNGKYSVSPNRTVDLSCGYYPAHTWVVSGLYHGQVEWDRHSLGLVMALLTGDSITDAYSSYEYPQFMVDESPTADVAVTFDSTNSLFLACENGKSVSNRMTIRNTSAKQKIVVNGITCEKGSIQVDAAFPICLNPNEEITLTFTENLGTLPCYDSITVSYTNARQLTKTLEKSFGFTALENYAGVVKTDTPVNNYNPGFLQKLICLIANIFGKIAALFK